MGGVTKCGSIKEVFSVKSRMTTGGVLRAHIENFSKHIDDGGTREHGRESNGGGGGGEGKKTKRKKGKKKKLGIRGSQPSAKNAEQVWKR